jgi:hypothetical protein
MMSGIQLSPELIDNLRQAVSRQAPDAAEDDGVLMQYLVAVTGYMLGGQSIDSQQKRAFLDEMLAFLRHVFEDTDRRVQAQRQARSADAFGYWTPGE